MTWYHDKRAGLIKDSERDGYICRGFRPEHGPILSAAPDMYQALLAAREYLRAQNLSELDLDGLGELLYQITRALAKAEGHY